MQTTSSPIFILTNKFGTTVKLTLKEAVALIQFIGWRRGEYDAGSTFYRYQADLEHVYRNNQVGENGLTGTFKSFVIDWSKHIYGYDHKIVFRLGMEDEKLSVDEVGKLYTALGRFIVRNVKGVKFPAWRGLSYYPHEDFIFTGYHFSKAHPGKLVQYKDGEVVNDNIFSIYTYTSNASIPRPEYIDKLCFLNEVFDPSRCTFDLSAKTSIRTDKVK